uniref:FMRFamide-like neuropeptide YMRF-amide n=1 Tax=Hirudo medicinalis TaxID=6421 RepID=FAR4_HIRME
YMRF